jgi:octaprenyl-diphosphate synthase
MKDSLILELHHHLAEELDLVNQIIIASANPSEEMVSIISDHLINSGGKRIRPIVTILSAKALGYSGKRHINLAAAVEFIHAATLLHDDVIDESDIRRGKRTANFLWGNKASILVGDFLFSQAFKLMVGSGSLKALDLLSSASAIIAEGEVRQLRQVGNILSIEEYYKIIEAKTAELFAASSSAGAAIAGATDDELEAMRIFGLNLGLIFQIKDDLLDYFGESLKLGKNLGQDFMESKCTLPIIIAMEKAGAKEREFFSQSFNDEIEKDFTQAVCILRDLDIEYDIETQINDLKISALSAIESLALPQSEARFLKEILAFATKRVN